MSTPGVSRRDREVRTGVGEETGWPARVLACLGFLVEK
jgi:hypothetical protein